MKLADPWWDDSLPQRIIASKMTKILDNNNNNTPESARDQTRQSKKVAREKKKSNNLNKTKKGGGRETTIWVRKRRRKRQKYNHDFDFAWSDEICFWPSSHVTLPPTISRPIWMQICRCPKNTHLHTHNIQRFTPTHMFLPFYYICFPSFLPRLFLLIYYFFCVAV